MRAFFQSLHEQKAGNDPQEYEDSWGVADGNSKRAYLVPQLFGQQSIDDFGISDFVLKSDQLSLAIADGATDSIFSKEWADLLVKQFNDSPSTDLDTLRKNVSRASRIWKRIARKRPMPWYVEEKVRKGAFCTFLGLRIAATRSVLGELSSIALGDCCLFQIRNRDLIACFPFTRPEDFGNTPSLLSTDFRYNDRIWPAVTTYHGFWRMGDTFLLMTDALAQWFMKGLFEGQEPWHALPSFSEHESNRQFTQWISDLRQSKLIRNDDVTLLVLKVFQDEAA